MTLSELCDPLFIYLCRLNLSVRRGGRPSSHEVVQQVETILSDISERAARDSSVAALYDREFELALVFFIDYTIASGEYGELTEFWQEHRLAFSWKGGGEDLVGDVNFFKYVEAQLADRSEAATSKLQVLYTCIGLGMAGKLRDTPEALRKLMRQIQGRLGDRALSAGDTQDLCPDAYQHTDESVFNISVSRGIFGIALAACIVIGGTLFWNIFAYADASKGLSKSLTKVNELSAPTTPAVVGDAPDFPTTRP